MVRRNEREISLSSAESLAGGLPIGARLRIGMELLRSLADGPPAPAMPRAAHSRLVVERVTIRPGEGVCITGEGDGSGAALFLWEILAGRALGTEPPLRLHDIVDDMPADVDDLVMGAVRVDAPTLTAEELFDALSSVAEPYAFTLEGLWDALSSGPVSSPGDEAFPAPPALPTVIEAQPARPASPERAATVLPSSATSRATKPPASRRSRRPRHDGGDPHTPGPAGAPTSTRTAPQSTRGAAAAVRTPAASPPAHPVASSAAPRRASRPPPTNTSATLPSMKAVVLPKPAAPPARPAPARPVRPAAAAPPRPPAPHSPLLDRNGAVVRADKTLAPPARVDIADATAEPPSPSLLLIHAGAESRSLADALREAGYPVVVCPDAASGLAHAIAENPLCILCDSDLPDSDGETVVHALRRQPSAVADAPIVLFASEADAPGRAPRFGAGADVFIQKPIRTALLVHQIAALVTLSSRLREAHHTWTALPQVSDGAAVTGDIRQVGIAAMLTILEMEKRTGSFVTTREGAATTSRRATLSDLDPNDRLEIELVRGCVAGASAMGIPGRPIDVLRAMMRLPVGRFTFKPTKARAVDAPSLRELLCEAARLDDEAAAQRSQRS